MAADAIQGCRTRPTGMKTPVETTAVTMVTPPLSASQSPPSATCSDGDPQKVVDEREHEVDADPVDRLLGQLNARHHVQQVVLETPPISPPALDWLPTVGAAPTRISTMSAASMATSVPVPTAMPRSA